MYRVRVAETCHEVLPAKGPNERLGAIHKAGEPPCERIEKFGFGQLQAPFLDELCGERFRRYLAAFKEVHGTRSEPTFKHLLFAHAWEQRSQCSLPGTPDENAAQVEQYYPFVEHRTADPATT
jgi:hypothetical protein